ncbi:hypothetical protein BC834DRAFT_856527 [Gloeopeniophorella convolvens]|nr:hypothetical protein BC834DRAFT_856527 [Gloeopeniophorella convolvens]
MAHQPPSSTERVERADLDRHAFAQYILEEHGTYFPKFADMPTAGQAAAAESTAELKQRAHQLQTQHTAELEKLYAHQAAQYLDDALDRYLAQNDAADDGYAGLIDDLYARPRRGVTELEARFDRETTLVRYAQEERRRRETRFPSSASEFMAIPDRDLQQRIARFLSSKPTDQDKIMSEHGWAWRQTRDLRDVFNTDLGFREEIRRRMVVVRDPRRKPTLP